MTDELVSPQPSPHFFDNIDHYPQLLVSVREEAEVEDALCGGADWIDFKEPRAGALEAVSYDRAITMARTVALRKPISAALGELNHWHDSTAQELLGVPEIRIVKLGLAGCASLSDWEEKWLEAYQQASDQKKQLAGVAYADWANADAPEPEQVLFTTAQIGAKFFLIDTYNKTSLSALQNFTSKKLAGILAQANRLGMRTVLAGSLQRSDMPAAVELGVDLIAVRGAACQGSREDKIAQGAVREVREAIHTAALLKNNSIGHPPEHHSGKANAHGKLFKERAQF